MFTIDQANLFKIYSDGVLTGIFSTILFNPADRALFLMVRDKKPIWDPSLWRKPYLGASKALYGRIVGYGVYLSFFDAYSHFFKEKTNHPLLLASLSTGLTTVCLTHHLNVIKMYQWSHQNTGGVIKSAKMMTSEFGSHVFLRGFFQTCLRDCLFSTTFFCLSKQLNTEQNFAKSVVIASSATALTSPINYLRSRIFFDFKDFPVPLTKVCQELAKEMHSKRGLLQKTSYIFFDRLNIGFGTLRVGLGMAVAQKFYHYLKSKPYFNPLVKE